MSILVFRTKINLGSVVVVVRGRRRKNESDRRGERPNSSLEVTVVEVIEVSGAFMAANSLHCIL